MEAFRGFDSNGHPKQRDNTYAKKLILAQFERIMNPDKPIEEIMQEIFPEVFLEPEPEESKRDGTMNASSIDSCIDRLRAQNNALREALMQIAELAEDGLGDWSPVEFVYLPVDMHKYREILDLAEVTLEDTSDAVQEP